jgi:cytochrome P450
MAKYPLDTNGQVVPLLLAKEYPEICSCGLVYVDTWPIAPPMLAVFHPELMAQFTQETSMPKHELMKKEFMPFTQCKDLVNLEGQEWKRWRGIFNPGFSAKNLLSFVPAILEEVQVFKDWLNTVAKSEEVVKLEEQAMKVTIDIIGRAVL